MKCIKKLIQRITVFLFMKTSKDPWAQNSEFMRKKTTW